MRSAILLVGLIASCSTLAGTNMTGAPDLIVFVDGNGPAAPVDCTARTIVTWMFARIGVRVEWSDGPPHESTPPRAPSVHIRFVPAKQVQLSPDALAYTLPFSPGVVSIVIVYERLQRLAARSSREATLLAHVIAHEIGHALQGTNAHAEKGIMKARWSGQDYDSMSRRPLEFTPFDVDLILTSLRSSQDGQRGSSHVSKR